MSSRSGDNLSHYTLLEKIGEGGMGVVYRARDERLHRHVAIKVLRPELLADPERQRRFLSEARAAAAITHPGIATVHEIDEHAGTTFIVMELVEGRPLSAIVRDGPLSALEAVRIAVQVASAMARAHEARIVHRDLKPDNILVGPDGRARILDFGLATILKAPDAGPLDQAASEQASTRDLDLGARLAGTVTYMSPEQARGEPAAETADIFSFGVTLYEMLAGKRPFAGPTMTATLAKILETEPEPLERLRPDLPAGLYRVVTRCLRKDPAERYAGAGELLAALEQVSEEARSGRAETAPALVSDHTIAVFPFSFRGSPEFSYLSEGLVDLLSTKLDGAGELRSVDPHAILCCPVADGAASSDPQVAAAAARRFGAGGFVLGGALELAGQLHLEATLYDASARPRVVSRAAVRGETSRIFEMVDQLTSELLARRPGGPATRLARIAAMATGSFEALKAYLEGEAEMRAMRRLTAVEAYRRAVAADPEFALAWYRLSVAALWSGQSHFAHEAARKAVQHGGRLSERDRHLLEAFDASLQGDNEAAERRYRAILGGHPDDVEAWYQLGELQMHGAPLRGRSIVASHEAWQRLIQLDPRHVNGWVHLGLIAASLGEADALESCTRHVLELSPTGDPAVWVRVFEAFSREEAAARAQVLEDLRHAGDYVVVQVVSSLGSYVGDYAGAFEVAGLLTERVRGPEVRALGHVMRAYFEAARGRWRGAARELDLGRSHAESLALIHAGLLAAAPFTGITDAELAALHADLRRTTGPPPSSAPRAAWIASHEWLHAHLPVYLDGVLEARLGRPEKAREGASRLAALGEVQETGSLVGDLIASLQARAAWAAGDAALALDRLSTLRMQARFDLPIWSPFHSRALDRFFRADLADRAGRHDEALRWFDTFLGNSLYDQPFVAPAHFRRAEVCERLGLAQRAAEHYDRFAHLWRDCDVEVRGRVDSAQERAKRLRGGASR